ncbi:MAG: Uma2 family endonuclease [Acidobacteriota bacterium]|jgi:Uma2 family endonuclease|nr:Uma2 family endonuclease [Acidobacteriota bacterium]
MAQTNTEIITSSGSQFVPKQEISYEEFLVKYDGQYAEYVDGEVIENMSVTQRHDLLVGFLRTILTVYTDAKKLGRICGEPYQVKMVLDDKTKGREPDIFFVKTENFDRIGEQFFDGAADSVIEVISPESIIRDTQDKFEEYEKAGVNEYWIIDPNRRTANFYGFDDEGKYKQLLLEADGKFESRIIEGLWIKTDWLWQEELPNLMDILKEWDLV